MSKDFLTTPLEELLETQPEPPSMVERVTETVIHHMLVEALRRALTEWNTKYEVKKAPTGKGRWLIKHMLKTMGEEM